MLQRVEAPIRLTEQERIFAEAYVAGKVPAEAAREAGKIGKNAYIWGIKVARRPHVIQYMNSLRKAIGMAARRQPAVVLPTVNARYMSVAEAADVRLKLTEILHSDIGSIIELVDDDVNGVLDPKTGKKKRAIVSLEKAVRMGVTHLIEEVSVTKDGIRVKFIRKMDAINALIRVLGMEEASEADKAKERAAVAEAMASLPPEVMEALAKHSLGPARVNGNGGIEP